MARGATTKRLRRCTTTDADSSAQPFPVLPEDVVFEVLARLPVRSVLRFRSACKDWLAMLSHPSFVRRHSDLSKENTSKVFVSTQLFAQNRPRRRVMFRRYSPGDEAVEVLLEHPIPDGGGPIYCPAHCDGLLAFYELTPAGSTTYVCNPATREVVGLPPRRFLDYGMHPYVGLCRDYSSGAYKVFHVICYRSHLPTRAWKVRVEVLTLGAENPRWRVLPSFVHHLDHVDAPIRTASVDRALYLLFVPNDIASPCFILSLDASTEKFTPVPAPPSDWHIYRNTGIMCLREVQGKLCFCCSGSQSNCMTMVVVEIWLMSGSTASPEWTRYCRFSPFLFPVNYFPDVVLNGREMLFCLHHSFCSYHLRSDKFKYVANMDNLLTNVFYRDVYLGMRTYTESLMAIITSRRQRRLKPTANCD